MKLLFLASVDFWEKQIESTTLLAFDCVKAGISFLNTSSVIGTRIMGQEKRG